MYESLLIEVIEGHESFQKVKNGLRKMPENLRPNHIIVITTTKSISCVYKVTVMTNIHDNKINFSSWYFPEYIPYPCVDINTLNLNCLTYDTTLNLNSNDNEYPIFYRGNFTKQFFNKFGRYNDQYFSKQYSIYRICKKIWKSQETPPSCRIVADSSRIGTKGDGTNNKYLKNNSNNSVIKISNNNSNKNRSNKCISKNKDKIKNNSNSHKFIRDINKSIINNSKKKTINLSGTQQEEHTPQTPSCRIVANSSRIGTNGVIQRSQNKQTTNSAENQFPSCRIVANDSRIGIIEGNEFISNQPPSCRIVANNSRIGVNGGRESTGDIPPSGRIVAIYPRIGINGGGGGF